ncbi:sulfotransferase domain-containing protein [Gammaproteobacteria bacterium]|nr:sulfotransferase domain-containing protein [Gammaproteobacteria bacterium]
MTDSRPVSLQQMKQRLARFRSLRSLAAALSFRPDPTDIFISPYPKCGTTWVQQIAHGLRSRGSMAFEEITEVVPWIEMALDMGVDLDAPQVAFPRLYKSHLPWNHIPKGARYICVIRNPGDALVSQYRFFEGWLFEPGTVTLEEFAVGEFIPRSDTHTYWSHLAGWWSQRNRDDVLLLCYEDMKVKLEIAVRRIARFMKIDYDPELEQMVLEHSSFKFMRSHQRQFDDHLVRAARDGACGIQPGGSSTKIRTGRVGDHTYELSEELKARMDQVWQTEITTRFDLASYEALRLAMC